MQEVLTEKYGAAPNTHERGTDPIEGVFMSEGMNIVKGGYTSFEESPSDHRWLFIDLDESEIVGESMEARARPIERKATAKIPSVKEKFNCELERQVTFHNLLEKVENLYFECIKNMEIEGKITPNQEKETDNLNDRLHRAIKAADQKCRKGRKGSVLFSPEAKRIMGEMRILKLLYWRARLKKDSRRPRKRKIERIAKKYNYKGNLLIDDVSQIKELMHKTAREYAEFRAKAYEFCQTHLGQIADELAERDRKKAEMHFRNLLQREETKTKFRPIKTDERRSQGGGISRVEKDVNGVGITITEKEEIENEIARVNKSQLQQANNTPL